MRLSGGCESASLKHSSSTPLETVQFLVVTRSWVLVTGHLGKRYRWCLLCEIPSFCGSADMVISYCWQGSSTSIGTHGLTKILFRFELGTVKTFALNLTRYYVCQGCDARAVKASRHVPQGDGDCVACWATRKCMSRSAVMVRGWDFLAHRMDILYTGTLFSVLIPDWLV